MGITVKNLRPGVLILADARLRLGPGETADVAAVTPQIQKAIDSGWLARLDDDAASGARNPPEPTGSAPEASEPAEGGRRGGQSAKRPPLDALRRRADATPEVKAEETAGAAG
jgi:hypothetical protein